MMKSDALLVLLALNSLGATHQTFASMTPSLAAQRGRLETKLLRKTDTRMSILVVVYILNYVSFPVKL